jgi:hypothetical protein
MSAIFDDVLKIYTGPSLSGIVVLYLSGAQNIRNALTELTGFALGDFTGHILEDAVLYRVNGRM